MAQGCGVVEILGAIDLPVRSLNISSAPSVAARAAESPHSFATSAAASRRIVSRIAARAAASPHSFATSAAS
jgi:hypothetical protein